MKNRDNKYLLNLAISGIIFLIIFFYILKFIGDNSGLNDFQPNNPLPNSINQNTSPTIKPIDFSSKYCQTDADCITQCSVNRQVTFPRGSCFNKQYLKTAEEPMFCFSRECRPECTKCSCVKNQCVDIKYKTNHQEPCC